MTGDRRSSAMDRLVWNDFTLGSDGVSDSMVEALRANLERGGATVLRGVCTADEAMDIRHELLARSRVPGEDRIDVTLGAPNFHRVDDEAVRARLNRDHLYIRHYGLPWNARPDQSVFDRVGLSLVGLRNRLFHMDPVAFVREPYAPYYAHWTVLHYPPGGAFLMEHSDRLEPNAQAECLLTLSRHGEDFHEGGLYVVDDRGERVWLDPVLEPGDLVVFRQDIPHGVAPVDPADAVDWNHDGGRWSMIIPVRPSPWAPPKQSEGSGE
jgi:hypothetical protein